MEALFGPSGGGEEFYNAGNKSILEIPKWIKEYGLDAFEYSFGHGYQMSEEKAKEAFFNCLNKIKTDYATLVDEFIKNKDNVTVDSIIAFIGESVKFD